MLISRPSSQPSRQPTQQPTGQPSRQPTMKPSAQPSRRPSSQPSMQPSAQPLSRPTAQPSSQPTMQPSLQPSRQPSVRPSMRPTDQPSGQPSRRPSHKPSSQPSAQPTRYELNLSSLFPTLSLRVLYTTLFHQSKSTLIWMLIFFHYPPTLLICFSISLFFRCSFRFSLFFSAVLLSTAALCCSVDRRLSHRGNLHNNQLVNHPGNRQ